MADQAEGVHAAKLVEGLLALLGVEVQQGLEIGAGGQLALEAELLGQLLVIIDLAVADHGAAGGVQGLPAALQVDDRQARVGHGPLDALTVDGFGADAVRAPVGDGPGHFPRGLGRARTDQSDDAAHQFTP